MVFNSSWLEDFRIAVLGGKIEEKVSESSLESLSELCITINKKKYLSVQLWKIPKCFEHELELKLFCVKQRFSPRHAQNFPSTILVWFLRTQPTGHSNNSAFSENSIPLIRFLVFSRFQRQSCTKGGHSMNINIRGASPVYSIFFASGSVKVLALSYCHFFLFGFSTESHATDHTWLATLLFNVKPAKCPSHLPNKDDGKC